MSATPSAVVAEPAYVLEDHYSPAQIARGLDRILDDLRPVPAARLAQMRHDLDWLENHGAACEEPGDRWDGLS